MSDVVSDLMNTIDELNIKNNDLEKENAELREAIRVHECSHLDEPLIHDKKLWRTIKEQGESEIECTKPVYKTENDQWLVSDEMARGLAFETRTQAALVLAMCPFVLDVSELMSIVKPMFRILNIKSKWSK